MLHTNFDNAQIQMTVFNPSNDSSTIAPESLKAPCDSTEQLIDLFEQITGWKVEFAESASSWKQRTDVPRSPVVDSQLESNGSLPAQGTFSIVDMSESWPANKPTASRSQCDKLVGVLDRLVGELQSTKLDLVKAQSALAALDPSVNDDGRGLVDSFIPKFGRRSTDKINVTHSDDFVVQTPLTPDSDFELSQPASDSLVALPFNGWQMGGQTGIAQNLFLDWHVDDEERISICAGEIEPHVDSANSVSEVKIIVDPLTQEYRVEGGQSGDLNNTNETLAGNLARTNASLQTFFLWDSKTSELQVITAEKWTRLKSTQAIVATTATGLSKTESWARYADEANGPQEFAELLRSSLTGNDPLVVLSRS